MSSDLPKEGDLRTVFSRGGRGRPIKHTGRKGKKNKADRMVKFARRKLVNAYVFLIGKRY